MEILNKIIQNKLTPNQFYVLVCIRDKISPLYVNLHMELRTLLSESWIAEDSPGVMTLQTKAEDLLIEIESLFKTQKKKNNNSLMGDSYQENIEKYQNLFPKKKLPSGKAARSAQSNVETNFRWFFEKHKFSWETILKATAMYVDEYERKTPAFIYMRTSAYFIRKTELDKSIVSDLANYCEIVESGDDLEGDFFFKEKVY